MSPNQCSFQAKNYEPVHVFDQVPVHAEEAGALNMQIVAELKSLGGCMYVCHSVYSYFSLLVFYMILQLILYGTLRNR